MTSRPKIGKSTLARCLAICVSRGSQWLGQNVTKGRVLYLSLEEIESRVSAHFRALGLRESDDIHVHFGPPPQNGVRWLNAAIKEYEPDLCIVDPIAHLVNVRDLNDYALVTTAMRPFLNMARESGAHVMLLHHNTKISGDQGREILGSTALFGIVDCAISLDQDRRTRNFYVRQRYGEDFEQRELCMDANGWITAGRSVAALYSIELEGEIIEFLEGRTEPADAETIRDAVGRKAATVKRKLRDMVETGRVERSGTGRKADPNMYSIPVPV